MSDNKHALYLYKDGEGSPRLFAADSVEDAKADGWKEPDFPKSNGTEWNAEEDLHQQDIAADLAKAKEPEAEKPKKPAKK